jgi:hypothetical protein
MFKLFYKILILIIVDQSIIYKLLKLIINN